MARWCFAAAPLLIFAVSFASEVSEFCRKKTSVLGGEQLICQNATLSLFRNFNLILNKTHWLTCEHCSLHRIDHTVFNFPYNNITYLYLRNSKIQALRNDSFAKFTQLKVLNLQNNSILELGVKCFRNLSKLYQLDLSYNNIQILRNYLFLETPNLSMANLNANRINFIERDAFSGLTHLKHLYLSHNRLQRLDARVFSLLPSLLILSLESNEILEIDPLAFVNLGSLNSLYLNNNSLGTVSAYNFKFLGSLVSLQLRENNLREIGTSAFNGLKTLSTLHLGKNRLRRVQRYGFIGLDALQNLELIENAFEAFNLSAIESLPRLSMLWLQRNAISELKIEPGDRVLESVHSVGLSANNLSSLSFRLLHSKLPSVRDLFVEENPWNCESLVNMYNFFQEVGANVCVTMDCDGNQTKNYITDVCEAMEPDETDFVADSGRALEFNVILASFCVYLLFVV